MAIPGLTDINIGAQNQAANSDSLWLAFNKIQNNFNLLANTGSNITTIVGGSGINSTTSGNTVTLVNSGVTSLRTVENSGIILNANTGDIIITSTGGGGNGGGSGTVTGISIRSPNSTITVSPSTPITTSGFLSVDLPVQSNVAAGNYSYANITVDSVGRITRVSNGSAGTVRSVALTGGNGISIGTNGNATDAAFTITNSGVTRILAGPGISISPTNGNGAVTITANGGGGGSGGSVSINMIANTLLNTAPSSNNLLVTNTEGGAPITGVGTFYIDLKPDVTVAGNLITSNGNVIAANGSVQGNSLTIGFTSSNVTSSGGNLVAVGNIAAGNFNTAASVIANNITANSNITAGNITATLFFGTLATNSQPNITSVGNLTSLRVDGNITANGNINLTSNIITTANGSFGNVAVTSNITAANITTTGNVSVGGEAMISGNANISANIYVTNNANITKEANIGGNIILTGNLGSGNQSANTQIIYNNNGNLVGNSKFTFTSGSGNLALTGNINVSNGNIIIANGDFSTNGNMYANYITATFSVNANAQANVTSLGNLVGLRVVGPFASNGISNTFITGGNANQFIQTDGTGNLVFADPEANGTGGNGSVQFANTANAQNITFMSSANIIWDDANNTFDISGANLIANKATVESNAVFANTSSGTAAGNVTILGNGAVTINNTSEGNATTGALRLGGGISAVANSFFNADITVAGSSNLDGGVTSSSPITTSNTDPVLYFANTILGGALQVQGSGGVGGDFYVGGNLIANTPPRVIAGNNIVSATPTKTLAGYLGYTVYGSGASITATLVGTSVSTLNIAAGGAGYDSGTGVILGPPDTVGGVQATATLSFTSGVITGYSIVNGGSGYTSPPAVLLSPGSGNTYYLALYS